MLTVHVPGRVGRTLENVEDNAWQKSVTGLTAPLVLEKSCPDRRYALKMPLLGLTTAQAKLAKWLVRAAETAIPAGLAWLGSELTAQGEAPEALEWRRVVVTWTRSTPAGTVEDRAQFKLDLLNVTSDEVDVTWTSGDDTTVKNAFGTAVTALANLHGSHQVFREMKYYRMKFNPVPDIERPFMDTGPPTFVQDWTTNMTVASVLPYQVAPAVTLRTAWAKHWGRIYLPTPGTVHLDTNGRLTTTYRAGASAAVKTLLSTLHDAGFYPVIPVGQVNKNSFHGLLGVTAVVSDDVPDIQRRRRPKQAAVRTVA